MMNTTLYKHEMKGSVKLLALLAVVITMYVSIIISMYDPKTMEMLEGFAKLMPELMAAVGMSTSVTSLPGFMISYLYGFILLIFPMVYGILRGHALVAKYVDKGSMVSLMAAPVKRRSIALTQMTVLISGIAALDIFSTVLEYLVAQAYFPGELALSDLLKINGGLFCLHLLLAAISFLASCLFSDAKYSIGFGAGIPALMYVIKMLANVGGAAEKVKYLTVFTLYDPQGILDGAGSAGVGVAVLLCTAVIAFVFSVYIFEKKDLPI